MQFTYTAVDVRGRTVRGEVSAHDRGAAVAELKGKGLVPTLIDAVSSKTGPDAEKSKPLLQREIGGTVYTKKLKPKKLLSILDQMAIMMRAGVSLPLAMDVLIQSDRDSGSRRILQEINDGLYAGASISQSMRRFAAFPLTVVSIVAAGEANGRLDSAFQRSASNLAKQVELRKKIRSAMTYPLVLLVLTIGLVYLMNAVVLPTFIDLFTQMGAELPPLTRAVMAFSSFTTSSGHWIALAVVALIAAYRLARGKSPGFTRAMDKIKLRIPMFGPLAMQSSIAQFCTIMHSLVESGVEIVASLEIAEQVVSNTFIRSELSRIVDEVKVGSTIHRAMEREGIFDPLLVSMIRVGEESGSLGEVFGKMAALYEEQTDESVKTLTALLEPAMTVVIAIVVGTVVISIVMPMFGMYEVIT